MIKARGRIYEFGWQKLVVSILLTAGFFLTGVLSTYAQEKPERLTSATYCSDAWVINFWNSESSEMEAELKQIREDGFNSIILVVPWREFQSTVNPVSYNPYAWEKLHRVMAAAMAEDLWVVLRVGYTWDYFGEESVLSRYESLLYTGSGSTRKAWLQYTEKLCEEVSAYTNYYGGFLTWEDFWNFIGKAGAMGTGRESVRLAQKVGYQDYLEDTYTLEFVRQLYQKQFRSFSEVYLPTREEPAFSLFYYFYDDFLNNLLLDTQEVFPDLSMEVRLDADPVAAEDELNQTAFSHHETFACGNSSFTSAMYAAPMGFEQEQDLEAEIVVAEMQRQLGFVKAYNGGKPIYLDQFLYMDTTEEFAGNSRLKEDERPRFLTMSAPALRTMTMGYGIWTYRNYTDNAVYNAQFGLGEQGWSFEGGGQLETIDGSRVAKLSSPRALLSQDISARLNARKNPIQVRFTAGSEEHAEITVSIGGVKKLLIVDGKTDVHLDFGKIAGGTISFQTSKPVWIDNVNVYSYEQDGQLYGLDGGELACIEAMRELNGNMR